MHTSIDFKKSVLWLHLAKDLWYDFNNDMQTTYVLGITVKQSDKYKAYCMYIFNLKLVYLVMK